MSRQAELENRLLPKKLPVSRKTRLNLVLDYVASSETMVTTRNVADALGIHVNSAASLLRELADAGEIVQRRHETGIGVLGYVNLWGRP